MEKPKNCYECEFCEERDTRFPYCGLTIYGGGFASMILGNQQEETKLPCPLRTGNITLEAEEKYREQLRRYCREV